jgi:hypothetical protein
MIGLFIIEDYRGYWRRMPVLGQLIGMDENDPG